MGVAVADAPVPPVVQQAEVALALLPGGPEAASQGSWGEGRLQSSVGRRPSPQNTSWRCPAAPAGPHLELPVTQAPPTATST